MILNSDLVMLSVDEQAVARAARVKFAVRLISLGESLVSVRQRVRSHFCVSTATAWRTVLIATDLAQRCDRA